MLRISAHPGGILQGGQVGELRVLDRVWAGRGDSRHRLTLVLQHLLGETHDLLDGPGPVRFQATEWTGCELEQGCRLERLNIAAGIRGATQCRLEKVLPGCPRSVSTGIPEPRWASMLLISTSG